MVLMNCIRLMELCPNVIKGSDEESLVVEIRP